MSNDFIFYLLSTARTSRGKNNLELDESAEYFFDYDLISKFASNASLVARRLDNHRVFGQPRSQEGVVDYSLLWEDERPWERGWCLVTRITSQVLRPITHTMLTPPGIFVYLKSIMHA